ncbi:Complete genome; segment 15/17 [Cupriavidus taiwanensis]|uniref:Complete genome segment 15/17 n=1 Tax=Cupriavidus taiwanensis TaxID=164546 RepID=A0A975WNW4_9BURK|nr:ABC-three component system protein [Cupriavidus taiwanensis]SOY40003.1 Complete genome; segment 15/17 [Cupriavidus taiwanensis]
MVTAEASAKIAGYTYQMQRALFRLLSSVHNKPVIGIETGDDVVELRLNEDGTVDAVFEQDKHSVQETGQPFQDSSKNLWHTFHIWLDSLESTLEKHENVCYCLVTNKKVPEQAIAQKLSAAKTDSEVNACIKLIRNKATAASPEDKSEVKDVSAFSDEALAFVIKRIELLDPDGTTDGVPLKEATIQLFHLPEDVRPYANDIYQGLLGQVVDMCQSAWSQRQPAWLTEPPFANRLQNEIATRRMHRYLERSLNSVAWREYQKKNTKELKFITQFQYIGLSDKYCDRALSHYWGFYAERVRLLTEGDVLQPAWDARDSALHERWQTIRDNVEMLKEEAADADDMNLCRTILGQTLDGNHREPLDGRDTSQPYFTFGHYHDLANRPKDEVYVYWHDLFAPESDE